MQNKSFHFANESLRHACVYWEHDWAMIVKMVKLQIVK
jgi:hypothetical protein